MHDPYDDDDGYNDDHYDYDNNPHNQYQWFFKFDVTPNTPLSSWINDIINNMINPSDGSINNIPGFPVKKFPVNSWNPNTVNDKKFQYLGSNYAGEPMWKTKYFVYYPIDSMYKNHLQSNAAHFVKQPNYYKGLFDVLN